MSLNSTNYIEYIDALTDIGIALSAEKNQDMLLEKILVNAMRLTNADAGTLYLLTESQQELKFLIFSNNALNIQLRKLAYEDAIFQFIPLYEQDQKPNLKNIACCCFFLNKTINIADAYHAKNFDFSGTKAADKKLGYYSKSFLVIPLRNHENKIIGVLQLINAIDETTSKIITFNAENTHLAEALASQAAITLTQQQLISAQKKLFESFIQLIAKAIDEKSAYTSKHCTRVPIITMMLADAVQNTKEGPYKDFQLTSEQLEELRIAAWLHDCGKVTTPEYVMDKATKLAALNDRIEVIDLRFEILRRDLKISILENKLKQYSKETLLDDDYQKSMDILLAEQNFLRWVNIGSEYLSNTDQKKIKEMAKKYHFSNVDGIQQFLLDKHEINNLSISKGTLNKQEREIIKNHVRVTLKMLESLPYPEYLKHIPEIAGSHHERVDGQGYPRGLTRDNMLIQARMVAIADIFEALTAADRPYKKAKTLSETLEIMAKMQKDQHIDSDLYDIFIREKIPWKYAKQYLKKSQIDVVDPG
ncbi:HD family phosphohydrolase [soil metagenome]